jgi:signal transduction histidine kinase
VIAEAVKNKSVFELEHRIRSVDGTWAWTLSRAVPLLDDLGEITEWFGAARDVSARRGAEEALRDGDRRKNEFLATLAHELRNPLAPLRHGLELAKRQSNGMRR